MELPDKKLPPRVLGILQNEWVYDPPRLQRAIAQSSNPEAFRQRMIEYALFAGCKTGRVLMTTLGETWCRRITWENASKRIGDVSSSVFPADLEHIATRIQEEKPDIVIAFGKVAQDGVAQREMRQFFEFEFVQYEILRAPHPCARTLEALRELHQLKKTLDTLHNARNSSQADQLYRRRPSSAVFD